jgi:putative ABC transport system permease protein
MAVIALERLLRWFRRLRLLATRSARERGMDAEMRHHLACEIEDRIRAGEDPAAARRGALLDFGGVERYKEEARDARGLRPLEDFVADVSYGARVLRRNPASTAAIVATFAVGIAAAGAIFSVVYGVLLRPLPYANPDRLVAVWERNLAHHLDRNVVSIATFEGWRARSQSFSRMAALVPRPTTLLTGVAPERVMGAEVSTGYFRLLGVAPALGRDFEPADEHEGGSMPVILSHAFWTRRFGADPRILGRSLTIADGSAVVVGVMPAGFEPPRFGWLGAQELWFPFVATAQSRAWGRFLLIVARLRDGVSMEHARDEMTAVANRLAIELPSNDGWSATVVPLSEQITGDVSAALRVLLGAVVLLLAIAVVNVAVLAAALTRRRASEFAIRWSIGATDSRLLRQLLTQHALLSVIGAVIGLVAVPWAVRLLVALAPSGLPRIESIRVDGPVVAVATVVIAIAAMVVGAVAAAPRHSPGTGPTLAAQSAQRAPRHAGAAFLVGCEIAVALALSVAAALMARSFATLRGVDPGFDPDRVVAARVATGRSGPAAWPVFATLLERIRAIPGVESAALVSARPLSGPGPATHATDPRRRDQDGAMAVVTDIRYADAALFRTLRIPLLRGRTLEDTAVHARIEVVVSDKLARALWPAEPAVGQTIRLELFGGITGIVVGVAGDVHFIDPRTPTRAAAYLSASRFPSDTYDVIVRSSADPAAIVPALRSAVTTIAPGVPVYQADLLSNTVSATLAAERFTTVVLSAFAGVALLLGGVGVFGVVASDVARRRTEIGIRMALGAGGGAVVWMMLRRTLVRAAAGVAAGVALALLLGRSMTTLLFAVGPADLGSYLTSATFVVLLAAAATVLPVVLAIRRSPLEALRQG